MRLIQRLKSLGMDLKSIKETLGDLQDPKTMREVLQSLRVELLREKENLEERLTRIDMLLSTDNILLNDDSINSSSFQMISEVLGQNQMEEYLRECPGLYDQHQKLYGILDDFQWGEDYTENFQKLAEYFKTHPEQYQVALDLGTRLGKLGTMSENDPEVENLARESAEFIIKTPELKEMLYNQSGFTTSYESLFDEMASDVLSPAQLKHKKLFQQYLNYRPKK
ncbi:MerR family transcriptional regulator [Aminipila terrae]|uniref:MerR family transcriptional regulator n=1 Tax=Aminipila terrae TaxID=2697030 RepID=UPI001FADE5DC|nr:MerR family transcriptional regulator [Aminipila terrae]